MEELAALLFEWESGSLDDAGIQRVRAILNSDAQARAYFIQSQLLSAALSMEAESGLAPEDLADSFETYRQLEPVPSPTRSNEIRSLRPWSLGHLAALAALLLASVLISRRLLPPTAIESGTNTTNTAERPKSEREATAQGVAVLTRLVDVQWTDEHTFEVGDALPPGRLAIESGFAQVEFYCGATVVLEGPAELELNSSTLARIHHGRLRAQVPPAATGFTIETAEMKVVDLGTEFGMSVTSAGADLHVFDGEVELHHQTGLQSDTGNQTSKKMLTAGQAISRKTGGDWANVESNHEQFVGIGRLESHHDDQENERLEQWRAWSKTVRQDPRLILYYAFDDNGGWNRRLTSDLPESDHLDGAIVGANRMPGRWPDKGALEFKGSGDRVRVHVPGEFGSLTFSCWTKIDSLDRWYNSLFLTDGYEQGEPHWQILDTGQLFFSTRYTKAKGQGKTHEPILSKPFWKPSLSGKWIHLATTFDAENSIVTHYLNGKMLSEGTIPENVAVKTTRIGTASIGNWAASLLPDEHYAIRNLNGSIDELAIFAAALSAEEIGDFYENGKP